MDSERELISLVSRLRSPDNTDSELISLITQILSLVKSMDKREPKSELLSLISQTISLFNSMDFDSHQNPLSKLKSLVFEKISLVDSKDSDSKPNSEFLPLLAEIRSLEPELELISLIDQIFYHVSSMDVSSMDVNTMDVSSMHMGLITHNNRTRPPFFLRRHISEEDIDEENIFEEDIDDEDIEQEDSDEEDIDDEDTDEEDIDEDFNIRPKKDTDEENTDEEDIDEENTDEEDIFEEDIDEDFNIRPKEDIDEENIDEENTDEEDIDEELELEVKLEPEQESKLISGITSLIFGSYSTESNWGSQWKLVTNIVEIINLVKSIHLDSQPKPESELMSLISQAVSLFTYMDLDSQPQPLSKLISRLSQYGGSNESIKKIVLLVEETLRLETEPELMSLIREILFLVFSLNSKWNNLVSLCPQVQVTLEEGRFQVSRLRSGDIKWDCLPVRWEKFMSTIAIYFHCRYCNGENHEEYDKAPVQIRHPLHQKHSLQLVLLSDEGGTRKCYCCEEDLLKIFYYCSVCDYAMNMNCVTKAPVVSVHYPKWHDHTLTLFPRKSSLTCDLCALSDPSCTFYLCGPCDFVVHQRCISLPHVIQISRHSHRISYTSSFDQGDWFCGVCQRKIDNDYGGYSCIKKGCPFTAHSRCATQSNVWDGKELEGEPEDSDKDLEPFLRIGDGIIQHFSHQHHQLRLNEDKRRDYGGNELCHACIMPIYYGNFYSCMKCDFNLHETCAQLRRVMYHPIHPHLLTLVTTNIDKYFLKAQSCSACPWLCKTGFFYQCKEGCDFSLHVQCATISEPLVHESHRHVLFLTSKPEERKTCSVCNEIDSRHYVTNETFNCLECEFSLCFRCATLPQKVRYKHDKHMLTLSYGKGSCTGTYWCEVCEGKVDPTKRFYMCEEYCCVTLHIECLLGVDFYVKPGSMLYDNALVTVRPNDHMCRPICYRCKKRCPFRIYFRNVEEDTRSIFCSRSCLKKCF